MPKRMQSPSSINIYLQCPRKYFYQYIMKLPTKPSIHLIRGSVVHSVLEGFFSMPLEGISKDSYEFGFRSYVSAKLAKLWKENESKLKKLGLSASELEFYLIDSQQMLNNFVSRFSERFAKKLEETGSLFEAFKLLSPFVEEEIRDQELQVRGFIDAIHDAGDDVVIMDYKTSNKAVITPAYRLQLGIYALLYKRKYGKIPSKVGIDFLKFDVQTLDVDQELMDEAEREIKFIHEMTEKHDKIEDYSKHESGLCKWSTGQCDFYSLCFENKTIADYR